MRSHARVLVGLCALVAYGIWISLGVDQVPFHPDESSLLYQSRDFELWLTDPLSLAWDSTVPDDYDQVYRALNAPLTKYVLGIGRRIMGYGPDAVSTDWDWSKTWQENKASEAFPEDKLLFGSRLSVTLLLPFSLLLIYRSAYSLKGKRLGYIAALLLATNALILLHDRRAMAEGVLTFGVCLAILGMLEADRRPWLAGLGAAVATMAKYSCAPLLLANFLACAWIPAQESSKYLKIFKNLLIFALVAAISMVILSPIAWTHPIQALAQIWDARQEFVQQQVETLRILLPAHVLETLPARVAIMLGHLYLTPLQFEEIGNYHPQIAAMSELYLANPIHTLLRNAVGAGLALFLTILGIAAGIRHTHAIKDGYAKRKLMLLISATALQTLALLIANPLPYQRYWIPVVPFICVWMAYGVEEIVSETKKQVARQTSDLPEPV